MHRAILFSALAPLISIQALHAEEVPLSAALDFLAIPVPQPREVAVGDLDRDGDLDVVIQSQESANPAVNPAIAWLENTAGDGSAWTQHAIDLDFGATTYLRLADVDGNGTLDVVATRFNNGVPAGGDSLVWYSNDGSPANDAEWVKQSIAIDVPFTVGCVAADIDRDGDIDVVLASTAAGNKVEWYENVPSGGGILWTVHTIDASVGQPFDVAVGDIDGDGWLDVCAASLTDNDLIWYENDGDPRNSAAWAERTVDGNFVRARRVLLTDVNGDGFLDVLACARGTAAPPVPGEVAWWQGDGGATWTKRPISALLQDAAALAAGDFDFDGDIDVFAGTDNSTTPGADDSIVWFENAAGTGLAWTPRTIENATVNGVASLALGDLDGDGDLELLTSLVRGNAVHWYENGLQHRGAGFSTATPVEAGLANVRSVATSDVNRDGLPDAVGASPTANTVAWWRNGAGGTAWTRVDIDTAFGGAAAVASADVDGDGVPDVAAAGGSANAVAWWRNANGIGTAWTEANIDGAFTGASALALADIDRDGMIDAAAGNAAGVVNWYENRLDSAQGWTAHQVVTGMTGAASIAVGDVNGDGIPDIVVAAETLGAIRWYQNDGTPGDAGSFTARVIDNAAAGAGFVAVGDADGDGDLDVYATRPGASAATVYLNTNGAGTAWTPTAIAASGLAAAGAAVRDFDRDGDRDVFVAGGASNAAAYAQGTLPGPAFTAKSAATGLTNPRAAAAADLNRDGFPDVLIGANNGLRALLNEEGYFSVAATTLGLQGDVNGATVATTRLAVTHDGRPGDASLDWRTLLVRFAAAGGAPLTTPQANALISAVDLYLDNGDGVFNAGSDALVTGAAPLSLTDGVQTLTLTDGDPEGLLTPGGAARTYFVAVTLQANASAQTPNQFVVTPLGLGGTAEETGTATVRAQTGAVTASSMTVSPGRNAADVNRDGAVNAVDVQLVVNAALGLNIGLFSADINNDGFANAVDVQLVINAALGL